jgi:sec-independent protein translocase protein TatA
MGIGFRELLVILVIVALVFGTRKLKSLGGDLGSAIKSFRDAFREGEDKSDAGNEPEKTGNLPGSDPKQSSGEDKNRGA